MSVEHLAVVLHHSRAKGTAKLILLGIANHQGDGGSWPRVSTLARYANVSERNVQKAIDVLASRGELLVHARPGRTNVYEVAVTCPGWCDRTPNHRDTRPTAHPQRGMGLGITTPVESDTPVASDTPPPSLATPLPPSLATPEPSGEPSPKPPLSLLPQPQDTRPCLDCGQGEGKCQAAQAHWSPADRHPYHPAPVRHATAR